VGSPEFRLRTGGAPIGSRVHSDQFIATFGQLPEPHGKIAIGPLGNVVIDLQLTVFSKRSVAVQYRPTKTVPCRVPFRRMPASQTVSSESLWHASDEPAGYLLPRLNC
jgi:hypothetical protein